MRYHLKGEALTCRHFGICGSCTNHKLSYRAQAEQKIHSLQETLKPFFAGDITLYTSPLNHYRMRAEFRVWHQENKAYYAMGNAQKNGIVTIEECPKVSQAILRRMWRLLEHINRSDQLKNKLFGVEFLSTTTDECLITMLYHRKLDHSWQEEARKLELLLDAGIIGRSRKQKVVVSNEYVTEVIKTNKQTYRYRYYEGSFTQPNTAVNAQMIEWVLDQTQQAHGDLLEAYCGHGNFTIPLSAHFNRVLATEISKRSIASARENCKLNKVNNITFVRMSSQEMSEALQGTRKFRRMEGVELSTYRFSTALVDPPRAGLDEQTRTLISAMDTIIYISCNPQTLARDLHHFTQTHRIKTTALFDQFPYTMHIECGVVLERK